MGVSVRRRWLERVNGYEEDPLFAGLSANARDLFTRLTNLGLHIRWHPAVRVYHPWHPGTLDPDPRYARQHRVIRARARSLETLPVKGLNPALPRPYRTVYDEVPHLARADLSGLLSRIRQAVRILVRGD